MPFNRNGVLFPRKIGGMYMMMSRPSDNGHTPFGDIYVSQSPDLEFWGRHRYMMGTIKGNDSAWQSTKVGPGPAPIETDEGWLLIYHGVITTCNGFVYRMGAALLDLDEPWRVKYRSKDYLLAPWELYECVGDVPNVVFPCAALTDSATGRIAIYYGCADTVTGIAFTTVDELIAVRQGTFLNPFRLNPSHSEIRGGRKIMFYLDKRIQGICDELRKLSIRQRVPISGWMYKKGNFIHPEDARHDAAAFSPFDCRNMHWYGPDEHYWFYSDTTVPESFQGKPLWMHVCTQIDEWDDGKNPQFLLFVNGEIVQGIDMNHRDVLLEPQRRGGPAPLSGAAGLHRHPAHRVQPDRGIPGDRPGDRRACTGICRCPCRRFPGWRPKARAEWIWNGS